METSPNLDRSPSLSSTSSGSAASSVPTPALPPVSSFPSSTYPRSGDDHSRRKQDQSVNVNDALSSYLGKTGISDVSNLEHGSHPQVELKKTNNSSPWSKGHRSSVSFDSARAKFGATTGGDMHKSPSLRTDLLSRDAPQDAERIASWRRSGASPKSIVTESTPQNYSPRAINSPDGLTGPPRSPTRINSSSRSPVTPTSARIANSPFMNQTAASPSFAGHPPSPTRRHQNPSPTRNIMHSSIGADSLHSPSARELSSAIFSSKAFDEQPSESSDVPTSLRRFDSISSSTGRGHRRAMTLPTNSLTSEGLPSPIAEEVAGLPGRARLSRPAEAPSSFAPSAVFSSSHGLSRQANGPPSPSKLLLPSQTVKAIDQQRQNLVAYEYLCHVRETQEWLDSCITTRAPDAPPMWADDAHDFEQSLRNGYALAHLARSLGGPNCQGPIYNDPVRHFRHTDNINIFLTFIDEVGLPRIFHFETVDLYDGKNLPKVIYCLHALSHLLFRRGVAQRMNDLVGQVEFTDAEMQATEKGLDGVRMPNFRGIGQALDKHDKSVSQPVETEQERSERRLRENERHIVGLQACARGLLARRRVQDVKRRLAAIERQRRLEEEQERQRLEELERQKREEEQRRMEEERRVEERRLEERRRQEMERLEMERREAKSRARARAQAQREHERAVQWASAVMVGFQARARGALARRALLDRIRLLRSNESFIIQLQAASRALIVRRAHQAKAHHLRKAEVVKSFGKFTSLARAALVRKKVDVQRQNLGFVEPDVVGLQAQIRGWIARRSFLEWRDNVYRNEDVVVYMQSLWRGALARQRYDILRWQLYNNADAIVKLQAIVRSRRQRSQYRQLRTGTNVPVSTIRNFARLLDDSEHDYRGELLVESLRKQLVGTIRETQDLEDDVRDLDTKIALLVKNKITHEVARAQRARQGGLAPLKRDSLLAAANDPFASEALDRQTQRKLELYQQMFWHLQTNPTYFAKLFASAGHRLRDGGDRKHQKSLETITFVVFGYAQAQREEYLLLKLFQRSIEEEMQLVSNVASFVKGNFTFVRLLMQYARGVGPRKALQDILGRQIGLVMDKKGMDLGTDPVTIYKSLIEEEERRTGVTSSRPVDVDFAHAVADSETNQLFIKHLIALRQVTDAILKSLLNFTHLLPYGIRFVARELYRALLARFPDEAEAEMLRVAGHLVYYRFVQPAIIAPETFDIVSGIVPVQQRQNLSEVAKLLNQVSVGRLFGDDQAYLMPMNAFIEASAARFASWMEDVIAIEDAEHHFRADEWIDAKSSHQPVVYISPNDIYSTHNLIAEHLDVVAREGADPLRQIIAELGGVPLSGSAELDRARADEVPLTLTTRLRADEGKWIYKLLFNQAKRRVLGILKVHTGNDLEQVLAQTVTADDETLWSELVEEELEEERQQARAQRRNLISQPDDIRRMTFHQLKMAALQDILQLRQIGVISKADKYQALLDSIAHDIRSKHHRRVQRQNEIATMQATLTTLRTKKKYLEDQIQSYHVYIDQSMASIQKKSKKRIVLPWSLQGSHERQLERQGKRYKYGSYKYTAQTLYDKGVLLSIDQYSPKQFDKVNLTISSDAVGCFELGVEFGGNLMVNQQTRLEDLLESQFAGRQTLEIGTVAKVNLNLLVDLINRKFYTS
ncbi:iqgap- protein [Microbotryomycetes sp. JL201]|nr:iqgap- protein [Microbotryomycetes sp. JL201]